MIFELTVSGQLQNGQLQFLSDEGESPPSGTEDEEVQQVIEEMRTGLDVQLDMKPNYPVGLSFLTVFRNSAGGYFFYNGELFARIVRGATVKIELLYVNQLSDNSGWHFMFSDPIIGGESVLI